MSVPDKHYAGDTLEFPIDVPSYPPADGWTLIYTLVARFGAPAQAPITLTGVTDPAGVAGRYIVGDTANNTALWLPGAYGWTRHVQRTEPSSGVFQKHTLNDAESFGQLLVLQNAATAAQGADNRSTARRNYDKCLEALGALIDAAAGGQTAIELTIGDRTTRYDTSSVSKVALTELADFWWGRVDAEEAQAEGRPVGPLGRVRYGVGVQ